jgi:hypothetical protein
MFLLFSNSLLHAFPEITKSEAEIYLATESNNNISFAWNINALGMLEIQDLFLIRGGTSIGMDGVLNIDAFIQGGVRLPLPIPVSFNTSYIMNTYPDYKTTLHSIIPHITTDLWRFELTMGYYFRFLQFDQSSILEQGLSYRVRFNAIDTSQVNLSIYAGNFSDFMAGNTLSINFGLTGSIAASPRIVLIGGIECMQTGIDGLTASFYGVTINGGMRICF